jgi:DNA gyrase/topoisomerase IV subunit A
MPTDLRVELKARIDKAQGEISELQEKRRKYDEEIAQIESKLKIWRDALELEMEHYGEAALPLFSREAQPYRFAGMKLIEAVGLLRKENPSITKKMARDILERNSFDFRGKRPGTAVHMVWVALDRRTKKAST